MRALLPACLPASVLAAVVAVASGCANTATIPPVCPAEPGGRSLTRAEIRSRPGQSLLEVLRARVAGIEVRTVNGRSTVLIRGRSSMVSQIEPLVEVDGVVLRDRGARGLERVEVSDVHSIEVLRSAAELSMYGISGGAGVVRISTRRSGCD